VAGIANLQINIDARSAIQKLREFTQGSRSAAAASQELSRGTDAAIDSLRNEGRAAGAAGNQLGQLVGAVGKLTAAYVGLRTVQASVQASIQRAESERRLQFLAQSYGELAGVQEAAARAGTKFGLSITQANKDFADLYGRLRPLNVSLSDIEAAFVGFNTAAIASGTSSAEAAGAMRQLSQALGSGVLRGDELNSVLEQAPGLVSALTKELGKPVTEIRKLAQEGKITSDVVIRALKRAGTEGAGSLESAMNGPAQAIKNMQNELENFQVAATKDLIPAVVDSVRILTRTLQAIGPVISNIGRVAGPVLNYINSLIEKATGVEQARFKANMVQRSGAARLERAGVGRTYSDAQGNVYSTITGRLVSSKPSTPAIAAPPLLGSMVGGGAGGGGKAGGAGKVDKGKAAEALEDARRASQMMKIELRQQIDLNNAATDIERERLKIQFTYLDRLRQIKDLKDDKRRIELKALAATLRDQDLMKLVTKEMQEQNKLLYDRAGLSMTATYGPGAGAFRTDVNLNPLAAADPIGDYKQRLRELQDPINLARTGAESISSAFNNAFTDIISGTKGAQDALSTMFRGIANSFTNMATDLIAQMLKIYVFKQLTGLLGLNGNAAGGMFTGGGPVSGASVFGSGQAGFTGLGFAAGMPSLAARAMGGPVTAGQPYLVGERGPELFVPSGGGNVLPNGKGGGNVTVNVSVDATGSQVAGDNEQASQLGRVIAAAVQSELIKAKRPGGILNS
jgi:tape measure domain-containing protein